MEIIAITCVLIDVILASILLKIIIKNYMIQRNMQKISEKLFIELVKLHKNKDKAFKELTTYIEKRN